jgi:hypothetical protein
LAQKLNGGFDDGSQWLICRSLLGSAALNTNLQFIPFILHIPPVAVGWIECNETQQVTPQQSAHHAPN